MVTKIQGPVTDPRWLWLDAHIQKKEVVTKEKEWKEKLEKSGHPPHTPGNRFACYVGCPAEDVPRNWWGLGEAMKVMGRHGGVALCPLGRSPSGWWSRGGNEIYLKQILIILFHHLKNIHNQENILPTHPEIITHIGCAASLPGFPPSSTILWDWGGEDLHIWSAGIPLLLSVMAYHKLQLPWW